MEENCYRKFILIKIYIYIYINISYIEGYYLFKNIKKEKSRDIADISVT